MIQFKFLTENEITDEYQFVSWTTFLHRRDIVSVQPLSAPSGHIFFIDYSYSSTKKTFKFLE